MNILSPKQVKSLKESNARINIWQGAVRSGKTYISLWRFLKELTYGPSGEYAVICRTYDSFKRNVLPQLTNMIGVDAKHYSGKREMHIWGKTVHIIGADDERAESKIRGPTFMGAYCDEVSILPESVFKMLVSRCAMGGAKIFGTTNPDSPFHWLKRDYLDGNPDVASWMFTMEDNPALEKEEREYLKRQYKGLWYQRFIEGRWVQAEGAIYDTFTEQDNVIDFPRSSAEVYIAGVDYGTTNPCAFVLVGINRNSYPNYWVEQEYYYDSRKAQRQKTDAEYCEDFKRFVRNKHVSAVYVDPAAASFKTELVRGGIQNVRDAKNKVIDGIRMVSTYMNEGSLKICAQCPNLISEFQSYVWDAKSLKTGVDKPLKENDHALDALRYAMFTHFSQVTGDPLSADQIDRHYRETRQTGPDLPRFFQQPDSRF